MLSWRAGDGWALQSEVYPNQRSAMRPTSGADSAEIAPSKQRSNAYTDDRSPSGTTCTKAIAAGHRGVF